MMELKEIIAAEFEKCKKLSDRVNLLNELRETISWFSPFKSEPVDLIKWVPVETVIANDYNPNSVAPPEMQLLRHSINNDGYTQPVVTWNCTEVVDGFHRTRVCREFEDVRNRVHGYLPVVQIQKKNTGRNDRIASTIRHNRARGKHAVDSMTDIVIELKRRNWSNNRIGKELGMDNDEILRLCQISGLTEMFSDDGFSQSWDIDIMTEEEMNFTLDEEHIEPDKEPKPDRILHTFDEWECHRAGLYGNKPPDGMTKEDCEQKYAELLTDHDLFRHALTRVILEWKNSCEHYLTNDSMNRIAWLGQAALCIQYGIPSCFRTGYSLLTDEQQETADRIAFESLNTWMLLNSLPEVSDDILTEKPKADIY